MESPCSRIMSIGAVARRGKDAAIVALAVLLAASWAYFLTRPTAQAPELLTDPDVLIIGMDISDAVSLDPARAYELTSCLVVNQLYDKLVDFEPPDYSEPVPEVAESWEVLDDGVTWIFHIRKGIMFTDGTPLTAEAVAFSLKRVLKLQQAPSWVLTQFGITEDSIEVVDNYTVKIRLGRKVAPRIFLSCLAFTVGAIVNPNEVKAHEKEGDLASEWMTDHSAGSGPFILEKWERESEIVLVANENYWKGKPRLKKIIIRHVPEPTDQLLLLEKGDIDIAWSLTPDQIEEVRDKVGIKVVSVPAYEKVYLGMNVGFKPFSDERVREAIRWAIDYDAILRLLKGGAMKLQTFIEKGIPGYNPDAPYYRDVEKARKLLAEAGYPEGFEVELMAPPTFPYRDIAAIVKQNLEEVGIRVRIRLVTAAEMYEKYRKQGHQLILARWGADYPDPDALAKPFADYRVKQLAWRNMWYDDYAADLVEKAAVEMDWSKRLKMYHELTEYVLHKGPYVILYQVVRQVALRTWVENFYPDPSFFLLDLSRVYKERVYGYGGA